MQRPSAPNVSTTYPVGTLVASAPAPASAPTLTPIATHSGWFCSVSCCPTVSINIPGVLSLSHSLVFNCFTHTQIHCNYLCILFCFFLLLFVFLTLFCLILLLWYFSLFVFCVSASSHQFCQLWLARCFVQLHYYKLIQHTPTTALPSIVCSCGCGCGYTFLGFRVAFTGPIDCALVAQLLYLFTSFVCLMHRPQFAVYFYVYDICFVALSGQKRTNFYVLLCFTPYYCMFIHQQL